MKTKIALVLAESPRDYDRFVTRQSAEQGFTFLFANSGTMLLSMQPNHVVYLRGYKKNPLYDKAFSRRLEAIKKRTPDYAEIYMDAEGEWPLAAFLPVTFELQTGYPE